MCSVIGCQPFQGVSASCPRSAGIGSRPHPQLMRINDVENRWMDGQSCLKMCAELKTQMYLNCLCSDSVLSFWLGVGHILTWFHPNMSVWDDTSCTHSVENQSPPQPKNWENESRDQSVVSNFFFKNIQQFKKKKLIYCSHMHISMKHFVALSQILGAKCHQQGGAVGSGALFLYLYSS